QRGRFPRKRLHTSDGSRAIRKASQWFQERNHTPGMSSSSSNQKPITRREFLRDGTRAASLTGLGGLLGLLAQHSSAQATVWQIDPQNCVRCGNCATHCVLEQSAVKCVHAYAICGYCQLCTGYFEPEPNDLNTGAENCLCPTAAIKRTF